MRSRALALAIVVGLPTVALADFYTLTNQGQVRRWTDSGSSSTLVGTAPLLPAEGLAVAPDGMIYVCGYNGTTFYRMNPTTGQATALPALQPSTILSFFKDLAWDPVSNSLLALHWGPRDNTGGTIYKSRLYSIDVSNMRATLLGEIGGLAPINVSEGTAALGLAIDPSGTRYIQRGNQVYTLDSLLNATALPTTIGNFGLSLNGLGFGPQGLLASGSNVWNIAANGSGVAIPGVTGNFVDVAYVVPAPGAAAAMVLMGVLGGRRKR